MDDKEDLKDATIVITGASSGIGMATAYAFARLGANLVLCSRNETLLQEVASECESLGGSAIAVLTDVTNKASVIRLKEKALEFYGSIDVWINNAGVGAIGEFETTPLAAHEQVIKTNLLGPLYGMYAILPYFKSVGSGVIINTNSTGAHMGNPFTAAYSASKFGLRGLSEALRYELEDYEDIHVCDVVATFVNSPGMEHAANYMGKEIKLNRFMISPEEVAEAMVKLAIHPQDSIHLGGSDRLARFGHTLFPSLTGKIMNKIERMYFKKAPPVPMSDGNLFDTSDNTLRLHGGH